MTREKMLEDMLRLFTKLDIEKLRKNDEQEYINLSIRISNAQYFLGEQK